MIKQRDVEIGRIYYMMDTLSNLHTEDSHTILLIGSSFAEISSNLYADVIHKSSSLRGIWKLIPLPKPKFFIMELKSITILRELFSVVDDFFCGAIVIIPRDNKHKTVEIMVETQNPFLCPCLQNDNYFFYFVDMDNQESTTGITEAVSIGCRLPLHKGEFIV